MTRIDFYRYAQDKVRFACRLAAKAFDHSSRVVVYSPDPQVLAEFDRALWTFQSTRFVPHAGGRRVAAGRRWSFLEGEAAAPRRAAEPSDSSRAFEHLRALSIMGADEADKERARVVFYKDPGHDSS